MFGIAMVVGALGFIGLIIFTILFIVNKIKKNGKSVKKQLIISLVMFLGWPILTIGSKEEKAKPVPEKQVATETKPIQETNKQEKSKPKEQQKTKGESEDTKKKRLNEEIKNAAKEAYKDAYINSDFEFNLEKAEYKNGEPTVESLWPYYIDVEAELTENFTESMVVDAFFLKTSRFLEKIQDMKFDYVEVTGTTDFIDKYGNSEKGTAIKLKLSKEEINKINFENFDVNKLPELAEDYYIHPGIEY